MARNMEKGLGERTGEVVGGGAGLYASLNSVSFGDPLTATALVVGTTVLTALVGGVAGKQVD